MTLCGALFRALREAGADFVAYPDYPHVETASSCTFDVRRPDTTQRVKERGNSVWLKSYGTGSVAILGSDVIGGDVVVPYEKTGNKVMEILDFDCKVHEVHGYKERGVSHIHISCRDVAEVRRFAEILLT
jgi:hypothetical protein